MERKRTGADCLWDAGRRLVKLAREELAKEAT